MLAWTKKRREKKVTLPGSQRMLSFEKVGGKAGARSRMAFLSKTVVHEPAWCSFPYKPLLGNTAHQLFTL